MFKFGVQSTENMQGVDSRIIEILELAITISKVDFGVPYLGGIRTAEQQNYLFEEGDSQLDGYEKKSYHQTGKAIDVYAYVDGRASWEVNHLSQIACAILQAAGRLGYDLTCGGLWPNFIDWPHFQLENS